LTHQSIPVAGDQSSRLKVE